MIRTSWVLVNWVGIYLGIALPSILGAVDRLSIIVASLVVGVQVGQTVVVQSNHLILDTTRRTHAIVCTVSSILLASTATTGRTNVAILLATTAGLGIGAVSGGVALRFLRSADAVGYQRMVAMRSAALLTVTGVSSLIAVYLSPALGVLAFAGTCPVLMTPQPARLGGAKRQVNLRRGVLIGIAASLLYRNDTNWVRAEVAGSSSFVTWNWALISYAGMQAALGVLTLHLIFAHRNRWSALVLERRSLTRVISVVATLCVVILAAASARSSDLLFFALFVAATGTLTTLASSLSHCVGRSVGVYLSGALGAAVLLTLLGQGMELRSAISIYLLTVLALVLVTLTTTATENSR